MPGWPIVTRPCGTFWSDWKQYTPGFGANWTFGTVTFSGAGVGHSANAFSRRARKSAFAKSPAAATIMFDGWKNRLWNAARSSRVIDSTDAFVEWRFTG